MLNVTSLLCDQHLTPARKQPRPDAAAMEVPVPVVAWAVTRASNQPCACGDASGAAPGELPRALPDELSFDEGVTLLKDLHGFGAPAVLFTGGEPLVRPDSLTLMDEAARMGLACTLVTNGGLVGDRTVARLAEIGVKLVTIPIDGAPQTHDALRKTPGAHAAASAAVERCRHAGLKVAVQYTLTSLNRKEIVDVFDLCIDLDATRLTVHHLPRVHVGEKAESGGRSDPLALTPKQTREAMIELFARARACYEAGSNLEVFTVGNTSDAGYLLLFLQQHDPKRVTRARQKLEAAGGNRAGVSIACIDSAGNVHYDQTSWNYSVGNVRKTPFSTLWREARDPRLAVLRNRTPHLPQRCQCCQFLSVCNGNSRVRAEAATGNWLGVDPACYLTESERFAGSN